MVCFAALLLPFDWTFPDFAPEHGFPRGLALKMGWFRLVKVVNMVNEEGE